MASEDKQVEMPEDGSRLIQDVLAELGWLANAEAVAESVRRLDIGLPVEDEFSVVCAWLGKCQLLHKLDQQQVPIASRKEFQVPDLLAKFSTQTSKPPVLIEIKSKKDKQLSFQPEYLQRLQNYADLVGMPLLIGWKFHSLWMLFEASHMKKATKNFNISLETAMQENLLGSLAGDVAYKIGNGAGIHLRFRKNKLVDTQETEDGSTEKWMTTIDDVAITDYEGNRLANLDSEVQSLFTAWNLEEQEEHNETHVHLRFVATNKEDMQFSHTALVHLLNWETPHNGKPHWRRLLRRDKVTASVANFSTALESALKLKVVSHVLHVQPQTMPLFLLPPNI